MTNHYFFCGIGGSGMLPLAMIAQGLGADVSGSDRSRDQGALPEKFSALEKQGMSLHPQDGSGVNTDLTAVIVSTAVEDTIPDIKAAKEQGIPIIHRADLLAQFFNDAPVRIAIAGTSGKTTTTGMAGYLLKEAGLAPTVMNGGVFRNYRDENPYCSALVGTGGVFVTEADESDGSIAKYHPTIAVLNNIALDHKPLEELIPLFTDYLAKADKVVLNFDSAAVRELAKNLPPEKIISYGIDHTANLHATNLIPQPHGINAMVNDQAMTLRVPGRYNVSNALAALGVARAMNIDLNKALEILGGFKGIKRRMDVIGTKDDITVIDDFAHNPDKIAASLSALKEFDGRLIVFFQPHGYALLRQLHAELADAFSKGMAGDDILLMVEPYYAGGTVDRSVGSMQVMAEINGPQTFLCSDRGDVKAKIRAAMHPGDRIVIMGARDDSLSEFAKEIYEALP